MAGLLTASKCDLLRSRIAFQRVEHVQSVALEIANGLVVVMGAPMIPANGKMRLSRVGIHLLDAGEANSEFTLNFFKGIGGDSGRAAASKGVEVPLLAAAFQIPASNALGDHYSSAEASSFVLAPTELEKDKRIKQVQAVAANATTTKIDAAASQDTDFYVGSYIKRLDTQEVREITDYTLPAGVETVTHSAWLLGTTTTPAGTMFEITHDNLIFRPSDCVIMKCTAAGAGAQPDKYIAYAEFVELDPYASNSNMAY